MREFIYGKRGRETNLANLAISMGPCEQPDTYFLDAPFQMRDASMRGDISLVQKLITKNKENHSSFRWLNDYDRFGWSPLHYAAFEGKYDICKLLVASNADVNLLTERARETPLFLAAAMDRCSVVNFFIKETESDPNIGDITGRIPFEVAYGKSSRLLSEERLQHGKLIRLIPTVRKLLASKITQLFFQLILCIFLELFQDKLIAVLKQALQLISLIKPTVELFIIGVFDRMLAPIVMPFLSLFTPLLAYMISPLFILLNSMLGFFLGIAIKVVQPFISLVFLPLHFLLAPLWFAFSSLVRTIFHTIFGFIWSTLMMTKYFTFFFSFLLFPFKFLFQLLCDMMKVSFVYGYLISVGNKLGAKIMKIVLFSLQPKQLAGKLVSPIILGVSKVLSILPRIWVDAIADAYKRIAGKSRHVSNEEVAAASLFLALVGTYIFGILLGGYIIRIFLVLMYQFDWYMGHLVALSKIYSLFSAEHYNHMEWKPDAALHELGLLFTLFTIPSLMIMKLIGIVSRFIIRRFFSKKAITVTPTPIPQDTPPLETPTSVSPRIAITPRVLKRKKTTKTSFKRGNSVPSFSATHLTA